MSSRVVKEAVEGVQRATGFPRRAAPEGTVASGEVFDPQVQFPRAEGLDDMGGAMGAQQQPGGYRPAPLGTIHDEPRPRVTMEELAGIAAYHGSPHRFDSFDISKIGTGEGAQAYGHGLYFAESEGVARSYRDALSPPRVLADGQEFRPRGSGADAARQLLLLNNQPGISSRQLINDALSEIDYKLPTASAARAKELRAARKHIQKLADQEVTVSGVDGALYTTRLNVEPDQLLDWDLPLSQQSEKVRAHIHGIFKSGVLDGQAKKPSQAYSDPSFVEHLDTMTGGRILELFAAYRTAGQAYSDYFPMLKGGKKAHADASRILREAGIPGIRYLDQGSRAAGEGTRNLVIFDDSLVDITHIDGRALTADERKAAIAMMLGGGTAAAAMMPGEAEAATLDDEFAQHREDLAGMTALDELLAAVAEMDDEAEAEALRGTPQEPAEGPVDLARNIGRDIAVSVAQTPRRVVLGGVRDAAQETLDLMASAIDAVDDAVGDFMEWESRIQLPEVERPTGALGEMGRVMVQFLTGFGAAAKVLRAVGIKEPTTTAGRIGDAAVRGAIADFVVFNEHEERLANLWQELGLPDNVLTDYLASDPEDSVAEGRLKNAIEGTGIGVAADGLFLAIRSLAAMRRARRQADTAAARAEATPAERLAPDIPQTPLDRFSALGDPTNPELLLRDVDLPVPDDVAARGLTRAEHEPDFFINWARIDQPEDVQNVMAQMADAMRPDIDAARRGVMTFEEIRLGSESENAWAALQARRQGQPLGAEQAVAARKLWASSAAKLTEVAKAAAEDPSNANLFAFRKMLAVHNTIQQEVIAARTETARALASWRIPVGSDAMRAREIEDMLRATGGEDVSRELAARVAVLADRGDIASLNEVARRGATAKTIDAVREVWINALLSSPKTHMVNMMSNTAVIGHQMVERMAAARIGRAMGDAERVEMGEAMMQFFGLVSGMKDAFRFAGKSLLSGETGRYTGKIDTPRPGAISSEAFDISSETWLGKGVDLLGQVARTPGYRLLSAEDEFFKTLGYRMELHAQAFRQASREVRQGLIPEGQLSRRVADIVDNPPDSLKLAAVDTALYQTFQQAPGKIGKSLIKLREDVPFAWLIAPFLNTPVNITKYTFERTPLAPLMSSFRADIAAGGARRDLAMARMSLGTLVTMVAADMAMSGQVSGGGPVNREERAAMVRAGWQPYSIKIDDRWFSYQRMDPPGMLLGMAADIVDITLNSDFDPNDQRLAEDVTAALIAAIGNSVTSKTWLTGLSEFFEMVGDPTRNAPGWQRRLAGTTVPSVVAEVRRQQDPYMREVRTMIDALRNRTPGMSEDLPFSRDLWGRPRGYQSGLGTTYDTLSPIYSRQENPEPIDEEILDQGFRIGMPGRNVAFDGVNINLDRFPGAYSRYLELAGNALELPQYEFKGAMDFLNDLVTGQSVYSVIYDFKSDGPEGTKEEYIRKIIGDYRAAARRQVLEEYPELANEVSERQQRRQALRLPNIQ